MFLQEYLVKFDEDWGKSVQDTKLLNLLLFTGSDINVGDLCLVEISMKPDNHNGH